MKRIAFFYLTLFVLTIVVLGACTSPVGQLRPTPTAIVRFPTATPTPEPVVDLIDATLLGADGVTTACDHPEQAQMTCTGGPTDPFMEVAVDASTFARWSMRWDNADASLTGNETLALDLTREGDLRPNLYFVEQDGSRFAVNLNRYGLRDGVVRIPLREVRDGEGNRPDFGQVNELQVVFEWADMAGTLALAELQFLSVWAEPTTPTAAADLAAALTVPPGFAVEPVADDLRELTQIQFAPEGDMLVSLQNGRIWWYTDENGDGRYDSRHLYDAGFEEVVGLLYDPVDDAVWIGGRGMLVRTVDSDGNGVADEHETRLEGLPWGRHQNNGLAWNPQPDPFTGEAGQYWIYFGLGSTEDLEVGGPYNATVLRFPRNGQGDADLEIVSQGNRNTYDVVWAPVPVDLERPDGPTRWQLFASENGPDFNDAPDEVNHIRWQHHYGFPDHFGFLDATAVEGEPYSGPVYPVAPHASADGIAYVTHPEWPDEYRTLYVALFGEVFSPDPVGHTVERVILETVDVTPADTDASTGATEEDALTFRGEPVDFVTGLDRPLPLTTGPDGNLIVGDYATGVVYKSWYAGE